MRKFTWPFAIGYVLGLTSYLVATIVHKNEVETKMEETHTALENT